MSIENKVQSQEEATYNSNDSGECSSVLDESILEQARKIIFSRVSTNQIFTGSTDVKDFFLLSLNGEEREHFEVMFLDTKHRLIENNRMFSGTTSSAGVHPREIIKLGLSLNASAIILAHNHPSGDTTPSFSDRSITEKIIAACKLVDITVLDHIIVGGSAISFTEKGLI